MLVIVDVSGGRGTWDSFVAFAMNDSTQLYYRESLFPRNLDMRYKDAYGKYFYIFFLIFVSSTTDYREAKKDKRLLEWQKTK